ncbi:hypothetical protein CK203_052229 [Vitis vinifera]|uniref:NAA35-like TPR repeats domain-containing protein n=1 Tax=Vitis vinifera TaxID=29760 RepID=A0A438GPK9_VITVI|nr:hypothetical protein CK203_052229 [Vitis vinifera]
MVMSNDTGKRKGKKKRDSPKDVARDYQIPPAVLFLQCHISLAEGLTMLLAALRNENRVFQSLGPFNTEHELVDANFNFLPISSNSLGLTEQNVFLPKGILNNSTFRNPPQHYIFIQHFELLQQACIPDHISYLSFKDTTAYAQFSTLVMYNYFKDALRLAKELRSSFSNDPDRMAELRKIEQVAEHNGIALNVICRVGALDPSLKVSFEFNHHPYFATAVVRRS